MRRRYCRNTTPIGSLLVLATSSATSPSGQHVERAPALPVRDEPARRFREREAQHEDDERARADHRPDAAPADRVAESEREQRADRPDAGAAHELHEGGDAAADAFGCIFGGIGKAQRLRRAEAHAGDEAADREPAGRGRHRSRDRRQPVEQHRPLEHGLAPEPVGELALPQGAHEQAEDRHRADRADFRRGREMRAHHVGHERAQDDVVDDVEEITEGDERQDPVMHRPHGGRVEPLVDIGNDRLRHDVSPPAPPVFAVRPLPVAGWHSGAAGERKALSAGPRAAA
jgi:hypothetical protein